MSTIFIIKELLTLAKTITHIISVGLFTLRVLARNLLRGNRLGNIFFSYFILMPVSNKPTHYLLGYDNFDSALIWIFFKTKMEGIRHN